MSFSHAQEMHAELAEQGIYDGDCFATTLDSLVPGEDLPDGFYYDLLDTQALQDRQKFHELISDQVAKHFRQDHFAFDFLHTLSFYFPPDGNPLDWKNSEDKYEMVPPEFTTLFRDFPKSEWQRVYEIKIAGEHETDRRIRAESAADDACRRLGMFVVANNMINDGASLMPVHNDLRTGNTHVFAVANNGVSDIRVINTAGVSDALDAPDTLIISPPLSLQWLCSVDGTTEIAPHQLNEFGRPYSRLTDADMPINEDGTDYRYIVYPVPPPK